MITIRWPIRNPLVARRRSEAWRVRFFWGSFACAMCPSGSGCHVDKSIDREAACQPPASKSHGRAERNVLGYNRREPRLQSDQFLGRSEASMGDFDILCAT